MAEAARAGETARRFLTFRVGERLYALPAGEILEVIRMPALARVPQAPKGLLGLANLRGAVLPVASLRGLLGLEHAEGAASRAVVLDGPAPVALAVDAVEALVAIGAKGVETRQAELAAEPDERLRGAFRLPGGDETAKLFDVASLLATAFVQRERPARRADGGRAAEALSARQDEGVTGEKLVTFEVAGQEFGLPLGAVREIVAAPQTLTAVPRAESVVAGVMAYRDTLLPLLWLRGLLGFGSGGAVGEGKVVVTAVRGLVVGLLAERMRAILPADPALMEATPALLAARTGGESRISAIYRGDGGRRLVSVLAPEQLFREDVMQRLGPEHQAVEGPSANDAAGGALQVLVFRLGDDEFGLPIEVVDEVARAPDQVTRVPKAPKFLEGVINLRGQVLPVIDQRRRFDMPALDAREGRRLVVVRTERHRAGVIVDSVSEVLRTTENAIEPAPELTGEGARLVRGVINLEATGRMVLLLDPSELLTRAERGLLDAFQADAESAAP